jgi:DNA helicase HerA-like ATPase
MNGKQILKDSIFKIGRVTSVDGRIVKVKVDKTKNTSHLLYKGELLKNISVGGYVKIVKGFTKIIGKVEGEYVTEEKEFSTKEYTSGKAKISRVLSISLLGFFGEKGFERGIKELPLIDNECYLLESEEFSEVHHFVKKEDEPITIGTLSLEKGQEIKIGVNSLFASHIGIFGNTGSGKSYTLAKIYRELFEKYKNGENFKKNGLFILFDFNGEYAGEKCIVDGKKVYNLTTKKELSNISSDEKFPLKEHDLIDLELISILANATDKTQRPFLSRSLEFYKKIGAATDPLDYFRNTLKKRVKEVLKMADKDKAHILIDYFKNILETSSSDISEALFAAIEWNNTNHHFMPRGGPSRELADAEIEGTILYTSADGYQFPENVLTKVIHFLYLQLIFDVYNDKAQNDHIAPAINKLKSKRIDIEKVLDTNSEQEDFSGDSNLVVVNLKDVNLEMRKTLPLLLSKKIYTEHKQKHNKDEKKFLNIIIDEAHNILSTESFREAESWKDYRLETFEEVIKEGRKFGVFLTIASQRPHDISSTIISQLHNYFLHRLINNHDIIAVERTIAYLDKLSVEYLSILPTGTCVLAGLLAHVPVVIDIGKIEPKEHEPDNETIDLIENWSDVQGEQREPSA